MPNISRPQANLSISKLTTGGEEEEEKKKKKKKKKKKHISNRTATPNRKCSSVQKVGQLPTQ